MKHTFLTLLLALVVCIGAKADELVSGESYRICSLDGQMALTNGGSTANNAILRMSTFDAEDQGQVWELTKSNGYWQIKSAMGNVCADNPSESHSNWGNQLIQWQTSGGNNQKWTFKEVDGSYYMIPYESSNGKKGYGYSENGKLTFQEVGGENTRFLLQRVSANALKPLHLNGYYTLQALSTFPDYAYKADGRFLHISEKGASSLTNGYSYEASRFLITSDDAGHLSITMPQNGTYLYATTSGVRTVATTDESHLAASTFMFYADGDTLTLDSRIAFGVGESSPSTRTSELKCLLPTAGGSTLTIQNRALNKNLTFRLVALPAAENIDALAKAIADAKATLAELPEDQAATLQAAIATAQSELDYPYVTKKEVAADVATLTKAVETAREAAGLKTQPATGISQAETAAVRPTLTVRGGVIRVAGAKTVRIYNTAGQLQPAGQQLPAGAYIVKADAYTFKVCF